MCASYHLLSDKQLIMPIVSKYTDQQVESILNELTEVLTKHDATPDLALMCLGNMASTVLNHQVAPAMRESLAEKFAKALQSSVKI